MSAAFSSRSGRFARDGAMRGPCPGDYDPNEYMSMAANAKTRSTPRGASFGGSSGRELPWQRLPEDVPRGASPSSYRSSRSSTPRSEELSKVPSTFGSVTTRGPSAAFSSQADRFGPSKVATPGPGAYSGDRVPLSPSKRLNRSASFNSKSSRFGKIAKDEGPGPGEFDAKPSSFAPASHRAAATSAGFGGRSARASPFEPKGKEDAAPGPEYTLPGAFSSRGTDSKANGGASFASRSNRFGKTQEQGTSDPGSYDAGHFHSMARTAGKSFNKQSSAGTGGFGTSERRPAQMPGGRGAYADSPGPAAYSSDPHTAAFGKVDARPSAAFASKAPKEGYVRATDSPTGSGTFNPDDRDSMGAKASRSFNRRSGSFGSRAQRELTKGATTTPGPGSYERAEHDPLRPSFEAQAKSATRTKGPSGWAATTGARTVDPAEWQRAAGPAAARAV